MNSRRFGPGRVLAGLLACLAMLSGCSKRAGEKPVFKVHGLLTWHGQPMAKARVSFYAVDPKDRGLSMHATAGEDGRYQLQTYRHGDGAPAGDYVVTITWPAPRPGPAHASVADPSDPDAEALAPDRLKNAYAQAGTSRLRATVRAQDNAIDFKLP